MSVRRINALFLAGIVCSLRGQAAPMPATLGNDESVRVQRAVNSRPPFWTDSRKNASLLGLDGQTHRIEDWKGKVIVLNFWASWCSSCLYEIQDFVRYQRQYGGAGLQIIGVGMDEEEKLRNVQRTLDVNYPVLVAPRTSDSDLMRAWGNRSGVVPYSIILDRQGKIISTYRGVLEPEEFDTMVRPLL